MSSCLGKQRCLFSAERTHVGIDTVKKNGTSLLKHALHVWAISAKPSRFRLTPPPPPLLREKGKGKGKGYTAISASEGS